MGVTTRKRLVMAEETMRQLDWQLVKENITEMIFLFDEKGNLLDCSDSAKTELGYFENEPMCGFSSLFPNVKLAKTGRNPVHADIYRKNETCFPVLLKIKELKEDNLYLVAVDDRTDVKAVSLELANTKKELEKARKYKNEFVSNITHELRTPVNGIQGMAHMLLDTNLTPQQLDTVNTIERCCVNMSRMINELLDFSKIDAGKLVLENKPFAVRDFLNKTMAGNIALVNEKGLKLIMNVAEDIPPVLVGDELRLTQILNNLISNAVKFTSVGHIALEVSMTKDEEKYVELFFMVMDTGIGIAKDNMGKLFKSFSQVDASITRRFGGTGLGLSISKQLVEMMGGTIKVESEEGKGSSFSFTVILGKPTDKEGNLEDIKFPSGNFVYEGIGRYSGAETYSSSEDLNMQLDDIYKFGTRDNLKEIRSSMDKLLICIALGSWEKAENFSATVKNLISDEEADKDLKREAFRLELIVRRGDHDKALEQYKFVKQKFDEMFPEEGR